MTPLETWAVIMLVLIFLGVLGILGALFDIHQLIKRQR